MLSPGDGTLEHSGPRKLTSISHVVKGGNELGCGAVPGIQQ